MGPPQKPNTKKTTYLSQVLCFFWVQERFGAFRQLLAPRALAFVGFDLCGTCVSLRSISTQIEVRWKKRAWIVGSRGRWQGTGLKKSWGWELKKHWKFNVASELSFHISGPGLTLWIWGLINKNTKKYPESYCSKEHRMFGIAFAFVTAGCWSCSGCLT